MKWDSENRQLIIEDNKLSMRDKKGVFAPFLVYCSDLQLVEAFLPENENDLAFILFKSTYENKDLNLAKAENYRNCYIENSKSLLLKLDELKSNVGDVSIIRKTYKKEEIIEEKNSSSSKMILIISLVIATIAIFSLLKK